MYSMRFFGRWVWEAPLPYSHLLLPCSRLLRPLSRTALPDMSRLFFQGLRSADTVLPSMLPICWQEGSAHRSRFLSGMALSIFSTGEGCLRYPLLVGRG